MSYLRYLFVALLSACALCPPLAWSVTPTPQGTATSAEWSQAVTLHDQARNGAGESAEKAVNLFTAVLEREPNNALAAAYLGSSYALMARDSDVLVNKVRFTNRGIRHLDQALEHGAENFTVRVIRANVNLSLPEMFKRADATRADIAKLDQLHAAAPTPGHARQIAPLFSAWAKSLGGDATWEAKARAANQLAAKKP